MACENSNWVAKPTHWSQSASTSMTAESNGDIPYISNSMDIPVAGSLDTETSSQTTASSLSSAPPLDNSTASPSPTRDISASPFSQHDYIIDSDDGANSPLESGNDMQWESSEVEQICPKEESVDDYGLRLKDLKQVPVVTEYRGEMDIATQPKPKRPRGRPRKIPVDHVVAAAAAAAAVATKSTKGRSKTGCITCRKRKKKCDEAKPKCQNCEKNSVICEGYLERHRWRSGKEKAEEFMKSRSQPVITRQPIFVGLESPEDRIFWAHYNDRLSAVFTVEKEVDNNAFRDKLVPLATRHRGLMHSLLSLSSKHFDYETSYCKKLLKTNPTVTLQSLRDRGEFHSAKAIETLRQGLGTIDGPDPAAAREAQYGQMLCFLLESLAEGGSTVGTQVHYDAFVYLTNNSPPEDPVFYAFIVEIFFYHVLANDLLNVAPDQKYHQLATEEWTPPTPIPTPRLIGVADGLFNIISQITRIRNRVRMRISCGADPRVDYKSLYEASQIEGALQAWSPDWPAGDSRKHITLLYQHITWLYLKTTICPPSSSSVSAGFSSQSNGMHPRSASTSCMSSSAPKMSPMDFGGDSLRRHSVGNSYNEDNIRPFLHEHATSDQIRDSNEAIRTSPPPIRRPENYEPSVRLAVEESLDFIESFDPSDPAQTLLLIPCVLVGAACYAPAEQERVRSALRTLYRYTRLANANRALKVLNEVWRLIDMGEYLQAWDWQVVAGKLDISFLF